MFMSSVVVLGSGAFCVLVSFFLTSLEVFCSVCSFSTLSFPCLLTHRTLSFDFEAVHPHHYALHFIQLLNGEHSHSSPASRLLLLEQDRGLGRIEPFMRESIVRKEVSVWRFLQFRFSNFHLLHGRIARRVPLCVPVNQSSLTEFRSTQIRRSIDSVYQRYAAPASHVFAQ